MRKAVIPAAVLQAVRRDRERLESERNWVKVSWGLQALRLTRPTFAKLEFGTIHSNGFHERSVCSRYYYDDGTYYSSIGL